MKQRFDVTGMSCTACSSHVERAVSALAGVSSVTVDLMQNRMLVEYDDSKLSEAEIMEITHFERGSGLISTNNNNITVEFKCSELEKRLITTDRRELKEILDGEKADMRS